MEHKDNEVNFFNNDFDNSIANSFTANNSSNGAGVLQSASFLFGSGDSPYVPASLSTSSIPVSSDALLDSNERALIPPCNSLPFLPPDTRPARLPSTAWTPHDPTYQNGEYFATAVYSGKEGMEFDVCDPIEREYLLEAKREQEGAANIETDLINLDYSYKSEELKERRGGARLPGHTSSSNTPNSSSSSGIKTPSLLPASIPTLSHEQEMAPGQVDLSHSHETICNEPIYTATDNRLSELSTQFPHSQQLNLSGEQTRYPHTRDTMEHNYLPLQSIIPQVYPHRETRHNQVVAPANSTAETHTKAMLYMQDHSYPPVTSSPSNSQDNIQHYSHLHTLSNPLPVATAQLHSLLTQQRLAAPTKRLPTPYNSAFLRPGSSNTASIFPPLNPPKQTPAPLLPGDQDDLEVQRVSANSGDMSRSELSIGASDPDESLPRCSSALETRFTPAPPSKQRKKTKSSSKRRVSNARDTCDTGSDQDRQNSSGGASGGAHVTRTSSYTSLAPQHVPRPSSRVSEPPRRSRNSKPFSAIPKPPQITTDFPIPGAHADSLKTSPPPQPSFALPDPPYGSEQRLRELPPVPDAHAPRYLPQPPKPYTDPNLTMPVSTEYPYAPYGYPPIPRWPAPSEEDPAAGFPPQGYFPFYNPYQYPYMFYPPYVPNGDSEEQQQLMPPGYPPYPFPYYPMPPPMYHCISHPGSRMSSYAPSLADDTTEMGSIYGAEDVTSQQQFVDSSFVLEQLSAQPISFENLNRSSTPVPDLEAQRETPLLFDYPHVKATFSRNGGLLLTPYQSTSGVKIHRLHELVQLPLLAGHSAFPGPLDSLSVKSEVVRFSQEHVTASQKLGDTDGALMWEYLSRLCAQNGVLVTSDVVELLTQGGSFSMRQIETQPQPQGQMDSRAAGEHLRLLVLQRRIKDAVEFCTAQHMWTHALLLAQTLDEHTRASVQDRFTYSLHACDPLQCYYSAVVGKRPHGVHAFYLREGHSWKQHLAILISHRHLPASETSISSLADNLAECAHTCAAHLVRLLQGRPLGGWGDRESSYALLGVEGSGHQLSCRRVGVEELHKTEVYEYARSLSNSEFSLPGFQPFKYQLAVLYAEAGLLQKALSYCEAISVSVQKQPCSYSPEFLSLLLSLSDRLHGSLVPLPSTPVHNPPHYPRWISMLSSFIEQQQGGGIYVPTPSLPLLTPTPSLLSPYLHTAEIARNTPKFGVGPLSAPYARPQPTQPNPTQPVPFSAPDAPLYRDGFVVGSPEDDDATTESYKSAGDESLMGGGGHNTDEEVLDFDIPSLDSSPLPPGMISGPQSPSESINRSVGGSNDGQTETGGLYGIVGNLVGRIRSKSLNRNQMRLPKNERFFYDYDKGMWIDKEGGEQETAAPMSPPKDIDLKPHSNLGSLPPVEPQGIMSFNPRSRYVDVLNTTGAAPVPLFPSNFDSAFSGTLFIPQNQPEATSAQATGLGRVSPDTVSVTTASISEASKEVRQILQNKQFLSNPLPPGMRY